MAGTIIVKGRMFSVDDTQENEIERLCIMTGTELFPDQAMMKAEASTRGRRKKEDDE